MKHAVGSRRRWIPALALALLVIPALALASTGVHPDDLARVRNYVGCSLGIAGAFTGFGMAAAVMFCLMLFAEP